jgi:hypothetical protein
MLRSKNKKGGREVDVRQSVHGKGVPNKLRHKNEVKIKSWRLVH